MNSFNFLAIFFLILAAIITFYFAYRFFSDFSINKNNPNSAKGKPIENSKSIKILERIKKAPCPLCKSMLYDNENLISRVYKTSTEKDQLCTIHGCPHCFPQIEIGVRRICPVCHREVPEKGHLTARIFSRGSEKKHVTITGCTECHKTIKPAGI